MRRQEERQQEEDNNKGGEEGLRYDWCKMDLQEKEEKKQGRYEESRKTMVWKRGKKYGRSKSRKKKESYPEYPIMLQCLKIEK